MRTLIWFTYNAILEYLEYPVVQLKTHLMNPQQNFQ